MAKKAPAPETIQTEAPASEATNTVGSNGNGTQAATPSGPSPEEIAAEKARREEERQKKIQEREEAKAKRAQEREEARKRKEEQRAKDKAAREAAKAERMAAKNASKRIRNNEVIRLLSDKNPKQPGSAAHARFAIYRDGMSVEEFIKAGGRMADVNWDLGHRFIALEPAPAVEQPAETQDVQS